MLTKTHEQINELLRELKLGSVLVQQNHDGTKCFRHYYLHKSEQFVTYRQTNRTLPSPIRCKYDLRNRKTHISLLDLFL